MATMIGIGISPCLSFLVGEGSGPSFWTPADIVTLGWWDPSDEDSITESGGSVSQIDDQGASAQNMVQGIGALQPSTGIRTIGGLNALDGDGSEWIGNIALATPASGNCQAVGVFESDSALSGDGMMAMDSGSPDWKLVDAGGAGTDFDAKIQVSGDPDINYPGGPYNGPSVFSAIFDTSGAKIEGFVDGDSKGTTTYDGDLGTSQFWTVLSDKSGAKPLDGAAGEVVITEDVSLETRQNLEGYLSWKWSGAL